MPHQPLDDIQLAGPWKRQAALFLISQNLSLFGSSVVGFAIIWHVTLATTSGRWMAAVTLAYSLPAIVISLWSGVWADRYSRKHLIMIADASVAAATLAVAVAFWLGRESLELLLLASAFRSLGGGVQMPAINAIYPQLVPGDQLTRVQGLNQTLSSILMLMSPVAGGLILGLMGLKLAFLLDVVTAVFAVAVMSRLKVAPVAAPAEAAAWAEMRAGLAYTFSRRPLKLLIICGVAFFFLVTPAGVLTPLMIARSFGPEVWRLSANELVWAAASILGGLFVTYHGEFVDKARSLAVCLGAFGLTFGLIGLAGNFTLYLILMGAAGFFMPIFTTVQTVFIQQSTPPEFLGRVFSIVQVLTSAAMPTAILVFGPLADLVRVESLLLVTGALMMLVGLVYDRASRRP